MHELRRLIPAHAGKTRPCSSPPRTCRAHPRSRGENAVTLPFPPLIEGSSPLTRGKRLHVAGLCLDGRLIPAHAGKTPEGHGAPEGPRAHPRSRGENSRRVDFRFFGTGSSPLTRGKLHAGNQGANHPGLIPAHAGKTPATRPTSSRTRAHPRSRGENQVGHCDGEGTRGSSPLTRGKHGGGLLDLRDDGLIPAHAGKTPPWMRRARASRAHPRSRGENWRAPAL